MTDILRRGRRATAGLLGLLVALCCVARPTHAGITAVLSPPSQEVAPDSDVEITLVVTPAGSAFNAFDGRLGFDPAALTAVTLSPLNDQIGPLFTSACGNLFHRFSAGAAEDTMGCSMLCAGVSVSGPGTLYRLRFHTSTTVQTTTLRFNQLRFFNAGLFVLPLSVSEAVIGIGQPPNTGADDAAVSALALTVAPSPVRAQARFSLELPRAGRVTIDMLDLQGRRVCRVLDEVRAAGRSTAIWNAADASGARVAPGAYFAIASSGGDRLARKLVVVR